jgi:oxalate decarboxylase
MISLRGFMRSKFFFDLNAVKLQKYSGGTLSNVTVDETSGLINISFSLLRLKQKGVQEPIWHPNANKVGYCQDGSGLVSIRSPGGVDLFTITQGDLFFIPQGYAHQIINTGSQELVLAFALNHSKPELMTLSNALYSLSDSVFTATFNTPGSFLEGLKKNQKAELLKTLSTPNKDSKFISSRFKFNIADSSKPVNTKGGYLQLATKTNLPILDGLGVLGFGLNPKGVVEPHWHTNAGELVYIVKGQTRITVLSPDGKVDVMEVNGGQGAFAPASHFHNIENVGKEEVEVIAFFSHAEPDFIGIGELMGSYSNEILGSVFNTSPDEFNSFNKPHGPLVIVPI